MCGRAGVRNKLSIVKELELGAPYPFRGKRLWGIKTRVTTSFHNSYVLMIFQKNLCLCLYLSLFWQARLTMCLFCFSFRYLTHSLVHNHK